jgi:hypothetical protein
MCGHYAIYSGGGNESSNPQPSTESPAPDKRERPAPMIIPPGAGSRIIHPPEDLSLVKFYKISL